MPHPCQCRSSIHICRLEVVSHEPLVFMNTLTIRGVMTVFLGLAVASLSAQTQTTSSNSASYIETSKIVGKRVKSSDGQEIGTVKDVVLDRNTGCMAYTVLSTGGGGGGARGGKMVTVPWTIYSSASDVDELAVTVDRERIYNAPVFDYARIDEYSRPDYIANVYSYYGVNPGSAVGVGVSGSATTGTTTTTGATTSTGAATTTGAATGAAGRAGPGGSPGASAPSAGGRSPAQAASPMGRGSPAPAETAARNPRATPRGRTRPTPSTRGAGAESSPAERARGVQERREESAPSPGDHTETSSRPEGERSQSDRGNPREQENATRESGRESEQSRSGEPASGARNPGTHHREKTEKHEGSSPPDQPQG